MTKKWINMLGGMCMAALLFVLSGCGKEDLVGQTDSSAEEGAVVSTVVPVTFHLQGEDLSRALTGVDFERFDVKAYIFDSKKEKKHGLGISGKWDKEWSSFDFADELDENQANPMEVINEDFIITLKSYNSNVWLGSGTETKYQYKVVFLAAPKGSSVLPEPSKGLLVGYDFSYDEALTNQFYWYAEENADNAVYRDVVEILNNDADNYDDIAFTSDINDVWVKLYHQDGEFSLNVAQNTLSEGDRVKATKATITVGNVYKQMYLAEKEISAGDKTFYTQCKTDEEEDDVQTLEKTFDLNLASGDQSLTIHSLPQYEGITCTIRMHDDAGHTYYENSFGTDAGVKIFPNMRTNVSLSATGFNFNIQLEDDEWDGLRQ